MQAPGPRPARNPNVSRAKEVTKKIIKKFGPFVLTGLAAVAEHHWFKHDNEGDSKGEDKQANVRDRDRDDNSSIRSLKREVRELRRSLRRKGRRGGGIEIAIDSDSDSKSSLEVVIGSERGQGKRKRGGIREVGGGGYGRQEQPREDYFSFNAFEGQRDESGSHFPPPPPRVPTPPPAPPGAPQYAPVYEPPTMEDQAQDRGLNPSLKPHRHRRHRHTSLPPPLPRDEEALHATKVATIAGIIEGLHIADVQGDWLGPKGVRVGTAMAAAAGTSYIRGKRESDQPRDMVVDVGTGLLVTRLVHGSSKRIEEQGTGRQKRRRWSHAY